MVVARKRILVTGARSATTLDMARKFHAAGHEVYAAEMTKVNVCHFSRAVLDTVVVPSPRFDPHGFVRELGAACRELKIDLLVPNFEEAIYIAQYPEVFPKETTVFSSSFETVRAVHNKWLFVNRVASLGMPIPKSQIVHSQEELDALAPEGPYILKAAYSRAAQGVIRVKAGEKVPQVTFAPDNPWIVQEWLEGRTLCTYSVCHNGKVHAHCTYPVKVGIDQLNCLMFEAIDHPGILEWIERFVAAEKFTGQIAFDFIETAEGEIYAIECNPRTTSGVHLFSHEDRLPDAFFGETDHLITPPSGRRRQLGVAMAIYGWRPSCRPHGLGTFLKDLFGIRDVVFSAKDLLPFILQPFIIVQYVHLARKKKLNLPAAFIYDLEWNGEAIEVANPAPAS